MSTQRPFAGMAQEATLADALAALTEVAQSLIQVADQLSAFSPDVAGRVRVNAEGTTVAVSGTSLNNVTLLGGYSTSQGMTALLLGSEADLRRNIVIS